MRVHACIYQPLEEEPETVDLGPGLKSKPSKTMLRRASPARPSLSISLIPKASTPCSVSPIPNVSFALDTSVSSPPRRVSPGLQTQSQSQSLSQSRSHGRLPRSHRNDPQGYSYVLSYTEQKKENEALRRELEHAHALLQVKADDLRRRDQQVEALEREGRSSAKRIQKLHQQVSGLAAKEAQLASAVEQLSKSGERALLALHQEKQEHESTCQRLGQLEVSTHKTSLETALRIKDQERQLEQQQNENARGLETVAGSLETMKARAESSEREVEVLRGLFREKQRAMCEMASEHVQFFNSLSLSLSLSLSMYVCVCVCVCVCVS